MSNERLLTLPQLVVAAAGRHPDRPFLTTLSGDETFEAVARASAAAAASLRRLGVGPGDRVLVQGVNSAQLVHAWFGCMWLGALPAAVNPRLTSWELQYLLDDLDAAAVAVDEARAAAMKEAVAARRVPLVGIGWEAEDGRLGGDGAGADVPAVDADPAAPAAVVYTSGTTSRPKGVLVTHAAYVLTGESFPSWIGLGPHERLWACMPLFHINGQAYSLVAALCHGYELALTDAFHPSTFWEDAARLGATETNLVGAMLAMLARQPEKTWRETELHTIYATPALDVAQRRALELRFGVRIVTGYGMTECPFGCIESPTSRDKESSIGRPRQHPRRPFGNELRIVDTEGAEAPAGVAGELRFRNVTVTPGYWRAPEITERTLVDDWLRTGDLGYLDADGDVILVGRLKEMIRRRGENIAPQEIEDVLLMHPRVQLAAAVGVPSELSEDDVVAVVVPAGDNGVAEEELIAWCRRYLAAFKVPARIIFRDALPMTPTMRVAKDRLREELSQEVSA